MLCNMHFLMVWFGILYNGFLHRIAAKTACLSHPFSKASETTSTFFLSSIISHVESSAFLPRTGNVLQDLVMFCSKPPSWI